MNVLFRISKYQDWKQFVIKFIVNPKEERTLKYKKSREYKTVPWSTAHIASIRVLMQEGIVNYNLYSFREVVEKYRGFCRGDIYYIFFDTRKEAKKFLDEILIPEVMMKKLSGE